MTEPTPDPATILKRYADGPDRLEAAIAGLAEEQLDVALSADTWTIRQIIHHLADGDDIWKTCIKAALGNSTGVFSLQWYWDIPQDRWVEIWDYAGRPIELSLARFRANRRHVVELLEHVPGAWERHMRIKWPHKPEEPITVKDVVEMQTNHVVGHIEDIRRIREAHKV
jgi:hypothetical protein